MRFLDAIARLLKRTHNAYGIAEHENVRQRHDGCGVHRFAASAEHTISDCRRVGMLAAKVSAQSSGNTDCSPRDQVRDLIAAAKTVGLFVPTERIESFGDVVSI